MSIIRFKNKGLQDLFEYGKTAKINKSYWKNIIMILDHLDAIRDLMDCVGVKDFHALKGDRSDYYAMRVSGNYRITFQFHDGDVFNLEFEDYH